MAPASSDDTSLPHTSATRRWLWAAVAAAFVLRMAVVLATQAYTFPPTTPVHDPLKQNFFFGFEIGRVARSIASGQGFGSPFHGWTGPTAWYPPIYPYLLAGVFKIFGIYSHASGVVILALNSLFAALTCIPIGLIAGRAAGRRVALASAWLWAVLPNFFPFAARWAWETALSTLLIMTAVWASVRLAEAKDWRPWFAAGVLWGAIALTNTSLLSLMPFTIAWAWWKSADRARSRHFVLVFVVLFVAVMPWMARNRAVMGRWIFVRDNFWAEMRFGNADQSRGIWLGWMNPTNSDVELARYREVGELRYIAEKKAVVLEFVHRRPLFFADLCLRRFFFFWCNLPTDWSETLSPAEVLRDQWWMIVFSALAWAGMALMLLRERRDYGLLLAPMLLVYPVLYYIASADARYRHPVEPAMLIFAVYAVNAAWEHHLARRAG